MNETNQPFTEHVLKAKRGPNGATPGWIAALLVAVLAGVFVWHLSKINRELRENLQSSLDETTSALTEAQTQNETNQVLISSLKSQLADLEKEAATVKEKAKSLEEEMRSDLENKDVTISKLQGKLTVNILDRVMFDSGEAILKPGGEAVMEKIATLLKEHPELKIHVIGHTDNIPIRPEAHSRFASNWELSTARALAALHFLTEKAGVDPHRVGVVGYGEYRPIADNSTAEGRAKNRRIAIMILPDELVEADTTPSTEPDNSAGKTSEIQQ